jgi:anhydro-N-acetylmuramic acid kinase
MKEIFTSIGLMSGTSMDGVDVALIKSDGKSIIQEKKFAYYPYEASIKKDLQHLIYGNPNLKEIKTIERNFTLLNAKIVDDFLQNAKISAKDVDLIGFHGHTIFHNPSEYSTWQIGDADLLFAKTQIKVIKNFRTFDMAYGGQGAPLVPIYHFYLLSLQKKPAAVLNIGGISNITYIPNDDENSIQAFDICFGNAPFDDLMQKKLQQDYDKNGDLAKKGEVDFILADRILQNEIFVKNPPKSFDRDDFKEILAPINNLKIEDALATFAYMHAKAVCFNLEFLSHGINSIYVCGGGRNNCVIMDNMKKWVKNVEIKSINEVGLDGDAIEAEAFAFLAIRMEKGLPISFRKTTGI